MDKLDPKKRIGLLVDEWGVWTDPEPGTNPGHLFQQNTMRDALIASSTLDIFNRHTDRIVMANIAQMVNVLQAMILTKGDTMVLTPTYYVFDMYKVHQDAKFIPVSFDSPSYEYNGQKIPAISCTLSKAEDGKYHFTISNLDPHHSQSVQLPLGSLSPKKVNSAKILTANKFNDYNSFEDTDKIKIESFKDVSLKKGALNISLPPISIVSVELQ